jgi:protein-tyrosine phosphatase
LHVLAWLERDAREVDRALRRGEHVWCHCAQGFNRGPSGVLAYLLSYTDATWQQACRRVSDARSRARTTRNTFHVELLMLSKKPKLRRDDHTLLDIRDGGHDPCDDNRGQKRQGESRQPK